MRVTENACVYIRNVSNIDCRLFDKDVSKTMGEFAYVIASILGSRFLELSSR